jgi:predicted ATP-grasp superfamily ATP-dependent carboligase
VRSGEITRVAPTTDLIAYYTSWLRDEFPTDVKRAIAPLEEVERALIKSRFSEACAAIGQPVPLTRNPMSAQAAVEAAHELGYPLILKPKSHLGVGASERGHLIQDEAELLRKFAAYDPAPGQQSLTERYPELCWPLLQRYIPSARRLVYSVSGIKDPDLGIVAASLSYKREQWPPDMGTSTVQISSADQEILASGVRAVDQLITRGIFELELLTDPTGLLAIDLNPRAFGFINLDIALGNDLPWLWMQSTLGPVSPQPRRGQNATLEARHTMLHFLRELSVGRARTAQPPSLERRDPIRPRAWISILGYRSDPVPMLLSHALLLRNPRSLLRTFWSISRKERLNTDATLRRADG